MLIGVLGQFQHPLLFPHFICVCYIYVYVVYMCVHVCYICVCMCGIYICVHLQICGVCVIYVYVCVSVCLCVCVSVCKGICVKAKGQLVGVGSFLPCGFWESNSGHQTWWQVTTKTSWQPLNLLFSNYCLMPGEALEMILEMSHTICHLLSVIYKYTSLLMS